MKREDISTDRFYELLKLAFKSIEKLDVDSLQQVGSTEIIILNFLESNYNLCYNKDGLYMYKTGTEIYDAVFSIFDISTSYFYLWNSCLINNNSFNLTTAENYVKVSLCDDENIMYDSVYVGSPELCLEEYDDGYFFQKSTMNSKIISHELFSKEVYFLDKFYSDNFMTDDYCVYIPKLDNFNIDLMEVFDKIVNGNE